jgi:hypothetical protein
MTQLKGTHASRGTLVLLLLGGVACGATDGFADNLEGNDAAPVDGGGNCVEGATRCSENELQTCSGGAFTTTEVCDSICAPGLGCVLCEPGTGSCSGDTATTCLPDGSGYAEYYCDPVQGMSCDVDIGACVGACAPASLGLSYTGCEYFPTVTGQGVANTFEFAVAIANTTADLVTATIEGGALSGPQVFEIQPGAVEAHRLPWVPELKLCDLPTPCTTPSLTPLVAPGGAYHLRTTAPVTVYQFSPLDYTNGANFTYTNDASLLLPSNALTGRYVVATLPGWQQGNMPSQMAVTATADDTRVTIDAAAAVPAGVGTPAFSPGSPQTVTLDQGDVLQLMVVSGDLTGTSVEADKPVQVLGAHYGIFIPDGVCCADHMEESMLPIETLSTAYVVTSPAVPPMPNGKERYLRIVATQPDTTVTYEPPIAGAQTTLAQIGDFIEIQRHDGDHLISADQKILVAEYMEGQEAGGNTGDPAMTVAVPTAQYRTEYLFHAPTNYEVNYVNVTAPSGATVTLDGVEVTSFTQIGSSGYGVARVTLDQFPSVGGNHFATGTEPFGITVYGYGQYTSYWYPGGLDLEEIPIE